MSRSIKILIIVSMLMFIPLEKTISPVRKLFSNGVRGEQDYLTGFMFSTLYAQEKLNSIEQAQERYIQGERLYSEGRYEEAMDEFEKGIELISPRRESIKETEEEQGKRKKKEAGVKKIALVLETEDQTKEIQEREYQIDIDDILDISVWQIPDLSRSEVIVRPDGKISFPLIGDIKVEGLSITQLDNIITDKLKVYLKVPEVSIMLRSFGEMANKVVVLGEISTPGVYRFKDPPSITETVATAGGYTKYAVLNSIMVIRGKTGTESEVTRVNVAEILKSGRVSENILLQSNDIVYVPRSFIGKLNVFLELIQPAINEYRQTMDIRQLQHTLHRKR